ncbi:hypothetical protein KIPB_014354, partial [Kipferlia bialata]|eukprot:g14354.t1
MTEYSSEFSTDSESYSVEESDNGADQDYFDPLPAHAFELDFDIQTSDHFENFFRSASGVLAFEYEINNLDRQAEELDAILNAP